MLLLSAYAKYVSVGWKTKSPKQKERVLDVHYNLSSSEKPPWCFIRGFLLISLSLFGLLHCFVLFMSNIKCYICSPASLFYNNTVLIMGGILLCSQNSCRCSWLGFHTVFEILVWDSEPCFVLRVCEIYHVPNVLYWIQIQVRRGSSWNQHKITLAHHGKRNARGY